MSATTVEVLRKAADLIEPEGAWTQGEYADGVDSDDYGWREKLRAGGQKCWCALGAIAAVSADEHAERDAMGEMSSYVGPIAIWNDDPDRTQSEVVDALRAAAERVEKAGV